MGEYIHMCIVMKPELKNSYLAFSKMASQIGAAAERVQRVHLHPSIFGNGCIAPVLRAIYYQKDQRTVKILMRTQQF